MMLKTMLTARSGGAFFSEKNCAPSFRGRARKALGKAANSLADNREDVALFLGMSAWITVMAAFACIG